MRIEPGHQDYEAIYKRWQSDGGTQFSFRGSMWMAIRDNDKMVFVKIESSSGVDSLYGSNSLG